MGHGRIPHVGLAPSIRGGVTRCEMRGSRCTVTTGTHWRLAGGGGGGGEGD